MEEPELQAILDHDGRHWWYRGRLRIVLQEVQRLRLRPGARILDAGCGSGAVLDELARLGDVAGVDVSPIAVERARARGHLEVLWANVDRLPWPDGSFDLVTCLDVLEHTPDDVSVLKELHRVTRPGGHVLLTVPAYPGLWSAHDELNHHFRRYLRRDLSSVARRAGLLLERDTHFNAVLLPPAAVVRLAARRRKTRSDLTLSPRALDPLLELPLRFEAALLRHGLTLPFGLSVAATYVRPPAAAGRYSLSASTRSRLSKQRFHPPVWSRTACSSQRPECVKRTVVAPSCSSKSISISIRVGLSSHSQVNASRRGGSISV
jgi:SAM-dependent methyltransferase